MFDDWIVSLLLYDQKILAVSLRETLLKRFKIKSTAAALKATWITGFNKKTAYKHLKEFFENNGKFRDEKRGKLKWLRLFNDENLRLEAVMVRERKGEASMMTAQSFCHWVNEELLPSRNLTPNIP